MITIKEYVDRLFKNVIENENSRSMKEEILQNLQEKVQDLINSGKDEEDAINKAIVDFGDFDELREELTFESKPEFQSEKMQDEMKYKKTTNAFLFSIFGFILIIGLMIFINYYYSPGTIWFVYPMFAVIWWPLAMLFRWLNKRNRR